MILSLNHLNIIGQFSTDLTHNLEISLKIFLSQKENYYCLSTLSKSVMNIYSGMWNNNLKTPFFAKGINKTNLEENK